MKFTERRIIYDFEKFGDSPACIGKEKNLENQVALTQGFGITENTTDLAYFKPKLLETNVTLISNDDCYNKIRKVVFSYRVYQRKRLYFILLWRVEICKLALV